MPLTVFDHLAELGIDVPADLQFYPNRATFDFECFFQKVPDHLFGRAGKLKWKAQHQLLSCSIASNVPNHQQPVCLVTSGDSRALIRKVLHKLHDISETAYAALLVKYRPVFDQLEQLCSQAAEGEEARKHPAEAVKEKLDAFIKELPGVQLW